MNPATAISALGAGIAVGASGLASALGAGIVGSSGTKIVAEDSRKFSVALLFQALPQTQGIYGFLIAILILLGTGIIGGARQVGMAEALGALGAGLAVGLAGMSAIGQGIVASSGAAAASKDKKTFGKALLFSALPETQALYGFIIAILIMIGTGLFGGAPKNLQMASGFAAIAAGLAIGLAGISAIGQGIAASSGIGSVLEKPSTFGKSILFSALPETQALYSFIISILILIAFGILGVSGNKLPDPVGIFSIGAGLAVGLAAVSAVGQGIAASSGIKAVSQDQKTFGKALLFSALPETQALYGFLIAILLLVGGGLLSSPKPITIAMAIFSISAGTAIGLAAVSAVGQGIAASSGIGAITEKKEAFGKSLLFSVLPETQALYAFLISILIMVGTGILGGKSAGISVPLSLVAVGAGLAVGLAAVSAIGQGMAAAAGIRSVVERAETFGKSIIFSIIPETQALMGFLIAILLLIGGGIMGSVSKGISLATSLVAIASGLAIGLAAVSAVGQGFVVSSSIASVTEKKSMFGKALLFSVLPQTQALYGFLIAILLLVGGGLITAVKTALTVPAGLVAIGAGLAVGLAAVSAVGQGIVASASVGAASESDKSFGKGILFSALPETQALYGFLIAILLLVGGGLLGAVNPHLSIPLGYVAIAAGLAVGLAAVSAVGQGMAAAAGIRSVVERAETFGKSIIFSIIPETQALMGFLVAILSLIGVGLIGNTSHSITLAQSLIAIGAGLAIGLAAVSAVGQGFVVSSSIASVTEKKSMFGKALLFSVLPQTQALYGFLIAILLLVGGGLITAVKTALTVPAGLVAIGAGLAVGLAAVSAVGQGIVASSGVSSTTENNRNFGKGILFSALPETQALYGFLIAILLLVGGGLLGAVNPHLSIPLGYVAIGAGLSVGLAAISAIGQGIAASSGVAGITESSKIFGKGILFSALPETQALYGTIIAILLITGTGLISEITGTTTLAQGLSGIAMGLGMGLAAISALGQGMVSGSSIGASLRDPAATGKGLVLSVIPETYAIFGLLISILIMLGFHII